MSVFLLEESLYYTYHKVETDKHCSQTGQIIDSKSWNSFHTWDEVKSACNALEDCAGLMW